MKYSIEIENRAVKQIKALNPDLRNRILNELESLQNNPRPTGCSNSKDAPNQPGESA